MRLGCCGSVNEAETIRDAGFDFLEVNVKQILRGDESDATWASEAPDPAKLPLPIEAANSLLPGTHAVVGPDRNLPMLQQYMQRVAQRAAKLGIQRLVFGSGAARHRPEGVSEAEAADQIAEFCRVAGDACAQHDVLLVIEHLHRGETNTINRLEQEHALIERLAHPAVAALVDSFHYGLENEPDEALLQLGASVRHVHLAEPVDRCEPGGHGRDSDDAFDFDHFFCLLRKIGYQERISIEAKFTGPIEEVGPATVAYLGNAWARAGECES